MRTRLATDRDVPAVLAMMVDFNRHEHIDWSPVAGEPVLRRLIDDPSIGLCCLLEDEGGARCGYAVLTWGYDLEWGGRDALLTEIWVEPAARGRGVGSAGLAAVEQLARANGARAMHLMVRNDNPRARDLYERSGFRVPDRVFMTKRLV